MGWLTDAIRPDPVRLWGMNEGELEPNSAGDPPLAAWFQVDVTEPIGVEGLLPLQPFLRCAGDVVDRLGAFELQAVQLVLPPPDRSANNPAGADGLSVLADAAGWFANCDRRLQTPVQIAIDGEQVPTITTAAPEIFRWTHDFVPAAGVFDCERFETSHDAATSLPGITDHSWVRDGRPRDRAMFSGTLVEWSLDALGWAAAFLAHSYHRHGVEAELVLTATRNA